MIGAKAVTAGSNFTGYAITRDTYGNFVANPSATWSLTGTTGGVTGTDLSPASGASSTFTGHLVGSAMVHAVVGTLTANTGTVTVSAGTATALTIETAANGTGTAIAAKAVTAGSNFTGYAITRDTYGNFVANPSATWSLTGTTGGVTGTDLSPTSGASSTFTGHLVGSAMVHAVVGTLTANTGTVTVSAGTATALTIETAANGTGTVITTKAVTAGSNFTGYAITRDTYGNFVANPSATWSLTGTTGGVTGTDLSPTSGASSTFTGHLVGSAMVHAVVGTLTANSGTVTVSAGSATQLLLSGLSTQTAGTAQSLTVTAQDAYGNTATGYTGTVHFTSSDGSATLPANYTFLAGDAGVHSFAAASP